MSTAYSRRVPKHAARTVLAFWTATRLAGSTPTMVWFISFDDGYTGNGDTMQPNRVRSVR
jgi:hypothetical protein